MKASRQTIVACSTAMLAITLSAGCQREQPAGVIIQPAGVTPQPTAVLGRRIESFTLDDYLGAAHSSSQWRDKQATVVVFLGTECPLAKLYGQRLTEMAMQYESADVQFVGINSNQQDTLAEMAYYARVHGIEFPLLKDPDGAVADRFGATRTPEAYVLDSAQTIRYWGRIDDQYGVGYSRSAATDSELVTALDEILAGKPVAMPETTAVGCLIARPKRAEPHGDITYCNQISRIVQQHCVECHRDGQIAPFALTSYDDVAAWSDTLLEVIDDGRMPPWHANPAHGKFRNDARMPREEKQLFAQWIANGLPEGDPADLPEPTEFHEGWRIPQPSVIYRMPESFDVPPKGTVEYQYFTIDPGFTEDKWVRASEARPGNRSVVHHLILFYVPPDQERYRPEDALFNTIAAFAPGLPPLQAREGHAMRIPAGSKLVFQVHYTPNGSPQTDISEAGLIFADVDQVEKELSTEAGLTWKFKIPPGANNHRVDASYDIRYDASLFSLTPHMHWRGKSFRISATYPGGEEEILLDVPRYDFNWQNIYQVDHPRPLPEGTKLRFVAHFDNSADNLANPDPTATVYWGDQTWQEMMIGTFTLSRADQDLRLGPPRVETLDGEKSLVHFQYKPPEAVEAVYLAGSFNEWKETGHSMNGPDGEGLFMTSVELARGEHEYKFVLDGKTWKSDPGNREHRGYFQNSLVRVE